MSSYSQNLTQRGIGLKDAQEAKTALLENRHVHTCTLRELTNVQIAERKPTDGIKKLITYTMKFLT